ncbi:MAG: leucine-rich repeat protein [Muribaculaceae bacterium]|nr:leucine-rich repeat protein [Muribaculaceae bacterium]
MWLLCAALPASALVSGIYNYEISNNKAVITGLTAEGANATTLNIPGHITNGSSYCSTIVGEGAFQNNTKLKKVTVMWGCQKLEANAFAGCSNLTELRIPSSMSYSSAHIWMGDGCLTGCTSLSLLSISADYVPYVSNATIEGVPTSCVLEVPNGDPHISDYAKTGYYFAITNSTWNKLIYASVLTTILTAKRVLPSI